MRRALQALVAYYRRQDVPAWHFWHPMSGAVGGLCWVIIMWGSMAALAWTGLSTCWLIGLALLLMLCAVFAFCLTWFGEPSNPGARRDRLDRKAEVERRARSRL